MNREYEQDRARSGAATTGHEYGYAFEPGQASRSALLRKPEQPIVSGLVQRKECGACNTDKYALTERLPDQTSLQEVGSKLDGDLAALQMKARNDADGDHVHRLAAERISGSATTLPLLEQIQHSFGSHDVSNIQAHIGGPAIVACEGMGPKAYATGTHISFHELPDLHTAAHEVAHVVQQRAGVKPTDGVGKAGNGYEKNADEVADAVVAEKPAEALLSDAGQRTRSTDQSRETARSYTPQAAQESVGNPIPSRDDNRDKENTPCPPQPSPGKRTLVEQAYPLTVQRSAIANGDTSNEVALHSSAARGVATPASALPHGDWIQRAFGRRDGGGAGSTAPSLDNPFATHLVASSTAPAGDAGVVQRRASGSASEDIHAAAARGIASPATSLPFADQIQASFGPRHDVASVQAHIGGAATDATSAMAASAYATGNHVVFASSPDLHTAAHEAAHVVQQRGGVQLKGGVGEVGDPYEQNADAVADRVVGGKSAADLLPSAPAADGVAAACGVVQRETPRTGPAVTDPAELVKVLGPKQTVELTIEHFRLQNKMYSTANTFHASDADLTMKLTVWQRELVVAEQQITTALNNDAVLRKDLEDSYRDAMQVIVPKTALLMGKTAHELFQAHKGELDPMAWPKGQVEADANTLSDAIPQGERNKIQVLSTNVIGPANLQVDEFFSTQGVKMAVSLPAGIHATFSGAIMEPNIQRGLTSVAASLLGDPLRLNSTVALALDLGKYGSDYASYRFTYYEHKPAKGSSAKEVIIERLGSIGVEGQTPIEAADTLKRFTAHSFVFSGTWNTAHKSVVIEAISLIPDPQLSLLDGMTFTRQAVATTDPKTAGNYDVQAHTITLFDAAFKDSNVRFGMPGQKVTPQSVDDVVHEIGHAIDQRGIRTAMTAEKTTNATLTSGFSQYESPPGSGNFANIPAADVPAFNKALKAAQSANKAVDKVVTESGQRFQTPSGGGDKDVLDDPAASTAFLTEANKDGSVRISKYGETNRAEFFAESYALYISDPDTLKRLRPNTFAFFEKTFRRTP